MWEQVYSDVEDLLVPGLGLDVWERVLYYHLLRHTRLKGQQAAMFAVAPLSDATGVSHYKVRNTLRSLHRKGCISIEDRSRNGHLVAVLLPSQIPGLERKSVEAETLEIESVDFFTDRRYVVALLNRDNGSCFYCLKQLQETVCELDHLTPQAAKYDNSYRNIVVACHTCNKSKGESTAPDFVRKLYRDGVLNEKELQQRLGAIEDVQSGQLAPKL